MTGRALPRRFYLQPTLRVARGLLGQILVHDGPDGITAGRIVEVEAYRGPRDRAAHSRGGHRSPRNEVMYGPPGHAYVYFVYGMHHCVNVVCDEDGVAAAVLLRALEPLEGIGTMTRRRGTDDRRSLLSGPAKICQAFAIGRGFSGEDLLGDRLFLECGRPVPARAIAVSPRIGVAYAREWAQKPFRFYVAGSPFVSGAGSGR